MAKIPIPGWQPVSAAAKQVGCSRWNIMLLIKDNKIKSMEKYGLTWVPNPLNYKIDRERQQRAKESRK